MALIPNAHGGIDLLKTVTELDKRVAALEAINPPEAIAPYKEPEKPKKGK